MTACESRQPPSPASADDRPAPSGRAAHDLRFCGGDLKAGAAAAYFRRLKAALESGAPVPMSFYDTQVGITSGGRYLSVKRDDVRPDAPALLSNAEWKQILDRGHEDLESIGWRGCMLADGKAAFQSDADGDLVLSSFDKDRPWVASHQNL